MKRVTLIFSLADERTPPVVLFAVGNGGLQFSFEPQSVDEFAKLNGLVRHEVFDWAVGDAGKKAVLLEWPQSLERTLSVKTSNGEMAVTWLNFKEASRKVTDGNERRLLQLAVQFIANGGKLDDSVLATAADEEILQKIKENMTANSDTQ